jgi:hypothetical protein
MTISWEYNPNTLIFAVEEYEKSRPVRRTQSQMILPRSIRMEMLRKEWGVSQSQIASAVRSGVRAKSQRRTTLGNLGKTERVEEMIEGATKQLLKSLFLRKSTSKRAKELEDQIQKVSKQRAQIRLEGNMKYEYDGSESMNPWLTELVPDDSEHDLGPLNDVIPEEEHNPEWSMVRSLKDDKPRLPMRETSDGDLSTSSSVDGSNHIRLQDKLSAALEGPNHPQDKQSSGESASQLSGASSKRTKPLITAEEPDDLLPGLTQPAPVEC